MLHACVSRSPTRFPVTTPPKGHSHLNNRGLEDLLHRSSRFRLRQLLGFFDAPHRSTFWWFTRHRRDPDLFAVALAATVRRIPPSNEHRQVALV